MGGGLNFNCCCCDDVCTLVFDGGDIKLVVPSGPNAGTYDMPPTGGMDCQWSSTLFPTPEYDEAGPCFALGQWILIITSTGSGDAIVWTLTVNLLVTWTGTGCPSPTVEQSWSDDFPCKLPREAVDLGNPTDPMGPATVQVKPA